MRARASRDERFATALHGAASAFAEAEMRGIAPNVWSG